MSTGKFWYGTQPELRDDPALWMDDPNGGDPIIIAQFKRIYKPELLRELCSCDTAPASQMVGDPAIEAIREALRDDVIAGYPDFVLAVSLALDDLIKTRAELARIRQDHA